MGLKLVARTVRDFPAQITVKANCGVVHWPVRLNRHCYCYYCYCY